MGENSSKEMKDPAAGALGLVLVLESVGKKFAGNLE
jgi:hypothetical protein